MQRIMTPREIAAIRKEYALDRLHEKDLDPSPIAQFNKWWHEANRAAIEEVNAMTLSTTGPDDMADARIVLLKAFDERGRISFLSIFSSNLDEFFRVRMPSIYAFTNIKTKKHSLREEYPKDLAKQVKDMVSVQLEEYGRILTTQILPALLHKHIHLYYNEDIREEHRDPSREYFLSRVLSFLQPVILRKDNRSDIFLENNALYFIVELEAPDQPGNIQYAICNIPSEHLPRFVDMPPIDGNNYILFLDDVVKFSLPEIFPGFSVHDSWSVKLTRDAELIIGDEFTGDLADKIEKQLEKRDAGPATRLLFDRRMPETAREFIRHYFDLNEKEMVPGGSYHNLKDLADLPNPSKESLTYEPWPA
ncbi:putative polyphosphate kinase, partial [Ostertagia ostertagi]